MSEWHNNLNFYWDEATPREKLEGEWWYGMARSFATSLARVADVEVSITSHMIAALSPMQLWRGNCSGARRLIDHYTNGGVLAPRVGVGGIKRNVRKGWNILSKGDTGYLSGPKVISFADNILDPHSLELTLDVWGTRALERNETDKTYNVLRGKYYKRGADAYRHVAKSLNVSPIPFQSTIWICIKRRCNNKIM